MLIHGACYAFVQTISVSRHLLYVAYTAPAAAGGDDDEGGQGSRTVRRRRGPGEGARDRPACDSHHRLPGLRVRRAAGRGAGAGGGGVSGADGVAGAPLRRQHASAGSARPINVSTEGATARTDQVSAMAE